MTAALNAPSPATAQEAATVADATAIRALYQAMLDSWGRGDGHAYAEQFTDDVDYIAFDGSHTKGRAAVAAAHQQLFDTWLKGTRLTGGVTGIRFLGPEVAVVHAAGGMERPGGGGTRAGRDSIQTLVAVKRDGAWRFTAFHNNRIQRRNALQYMIFGIATRLFGK